LTTKKDAAERIGANLALAAKIRSGLSREPGALRRREALRNWQAARLAHTHQDLLDSPRYAKTAAFFLTDIYGPKDLSQHLDAVRRILPLMLKLLPSAGLETVADAIELNALSESLDAGMAASLDDKVYSLTGLDYVTAYQRLGREEDRERQIDLIYHLGHSLDRLTRKPLIGATLTIMRGPAAAAGVSEVHDFLERGYAAFREMNGADEFLEKITARERALSLAWFAGDSFGAEIGS